MSPSRSLTGFTAFCLVCLISLGFIVASCSSEQKPELLNFSSTEILVSLVDTDSSSIENQLLNLGLQLLESYSSIGVHRVRVLKENVSTAVKRLNADSRVLFAEPNYRFQVDAVVPVDPDYSLQEWYWDLLGAPDAWEITTGDRKIIVAVLDSGIDLDHPDLAGNIWTNSNEIPHNDVDDDRNGYIDDVNGYDFVGAWPGDDTAIGQDSNPDVFLGDSAVGDGIDQDGDGIADDGVGHGTQVAGIIGAIGNNNTDIAGATWNVSIMPIRISGPEGAGYQSSVIEGINYALTNGADIANISFGTTVITTSARLAFNAAIDAGLHIVASAGNDGMFSAFPAALEGVISVGAHGSGYKATDVDTEDASSLRASFSPRFGKVEVVAPGVNVYTLNVSAITGEANLAFVSGTSIAAPFVSGLIALMLSIDPTLSSKEILRLLEDNAKDLPDLGFPRWDGAGRVHFGQTITALRELRLTTPVITDITLTETSLIVVGTAAPFIAVGVRDANDSTVIGYETTDVDGMFRLVVDKIVGLAHLSETQPKLSLVAVAESSVGVSVSSDAKTVGLPRTVTLWPGWNLVSWSGTGSSGVEVIATLPEVVDAVYVWRGGKWDFALPGSPLFPLEGYIRTGQGLWVHLEGAETTEWKQTRDFLDITLLESGWQLVSWAGPTMAAAQAAAGSNIGIAQLVIWDPTRTAFQWFVVNLPVGVLRDPLTSLRHLEAVWVYVDGEGGEWPKM